MYTAIPQLDWALQGLYASIKTNTDYMWEVVFRWLSSTVKIPVEKAKSSKSLHPEALEQLPKMSNGKPDGKERRIKSKLCVQRGLKGISEWRNLNAD